MMSPRSLPLAVWQDFDGDFGRDLRIVLNTDTRLFLIDAKTGKPNGRPHRGGGPLHPF